MESGWFFHPVKGSWLPECSGRFYKSRHRTARRRRVYAVLPVERTRVPAFQWFLCRVMQIEIS